MACSGILHSPLALASTLAGALWLGGCADVLRTTKPELPPFRDASMSLQTASDLTVPGTTTKTQTLAALGPAIVVKFDSGFEVWIYRAKSPGAPEEPAELVILFSPEGIASKTRIRPNYGQRIR